MSVKARLYERKGHINQALDSIEQGITLLQEAGDQPQTIELMVQKASILQADGKTAQAENILKEVFHNPYLHHNPSVHFEAQMQYAMVLHASGNMQAADQLLKDLHNTRGTESQHAALHYNLWVIHGTDEYARIALDLYQKLVCNTPNIEYQKRLQELQATREKRKISPGKSA